MKLFVLMNVEKTTFVGMFLFIGKLVYINKIKVSRSQYKLTKEIKDLIIVQ